MRSATPFSAMRRTPRAGELELALEAVSSIRSTTSVGRSASIRNTTSPRPAATGDPSSRVRSSAASAPDSGLIRPRRLLDKQRARGVEVAGVMPRARRLPASEERLEDRVDELSLRLRIHHFFFFALFLEPQHVLREDLNGQVR